MRPRLLDLFCGAGCCSVGYHRAGFDVVGVDNRPMPRYPFEFVQHDAIQFLEMISSRGKTNVDGKWYFLEDFDVIHASPPCQAFSVSTAVHGKKGREKHPNLIEPCRLLLDEIGKPWIMENVQGAPMKTPSIMLCGMMFKLRVLRHRWFESNQMLLQPTHPKHPPGMLTNSHRAYDRGQSPFVCLAGHNFKREEGEAAMQIDWMKSRAELAQAIPPAYTEFIGKQLMMMLENRSS